MPKQTIAKLASGLWRVSTADAMALIEISKRARPVTAGQRGKHTYARGEHEMMLGVYTADLPSLTAGTGAVGARYGAAPSPSGEAPAEE